MTLPLPDHLSYSAAISTFKSCPRAFYLSRIKRAESAQAWYFVVGSAVHSFIEQHLLNKEDMGTLDIDEFFMAEVMSARQVEPDTTKWLHATVNDIPVIEERALKLAQDCAEYALEWLEDFTPWHVEPDISGMLPGCTMPIKAFPDLIGEHSKHGPLIVDWKTGKTRGQRMQLETYKSLLGTWDSMTDVKWHELRGMFVYLNPEAQKSRPVKLVMTPKEVGAMYGEIERKIKAGAFPAMPQFMCDFCTMKPNCKTKSGANPRTLYYDTPEKDGLVPF